MPKKTLILNNGKTAVLSWEQGWKRVTISQNQHEIFTFADKEALKLGQKIGLSDGETVYVRLMNGDLEAWYNGQELVSNLKSGHSDHFKTAYQTLWGVGGLQVFFGLFTALVMGNAISTNDTRDFSIEVFVLGFIPFIGLVNIGLGFWAQRLNVKTPLMIGIFLILLLGLTFNLFAYVAIAGISYIFYKGIKAPIISYSDEEVTINEDTPLDQM